jgi:hypothetical protein
MKKQKTKDTTQMKMAAKFSFILLQRNWKTCTNLFLIVIDTILAIILIIMEECYAALKGV